MASAVSPGAIGAVALTRRPAALAAVQATDGLPTHRWPSVGELGTTDRGQTTRYRLGNHSRIGGAVRLAEKTRRASVVALARVRTYPEMSTLESA